MTMFTHKKDLLPRYSDYDLIHYSLDDVQDNNGFVSLTGLVDHAKNKYGILGKEAYTAILLLKLDGHLRINKKQHEELFNYVNKNGDLW